MSIILKGIDLPKENDSLNISILNGKVYERTASFLEEEIDGTQVIQIPKGHGDIVDRDELIIRRDIESDRGIIGYCEAINNDANVLLKSEEE